MTWAETRQDTDDRTRIEIHQAVVAIVKAAGRPLSTGEIKERLTAVRGVSEFFQVFAVAPLVQVRPASGESVRGISRCLARSRPNFSRS